MLHLGAGHHRAPGDHVRLGHRVHAPFGIPDARQPVGDRAPDRPVRAGVRPVGLPRGDDAVAVVREPGERLGQRARRADGAVGDDQRRLVALQVTGRQRAAGRLGDVDQVAELGDADLVRAVEAPDDVVDCGRVERGDDLGVERGVRRHAARLPRPGVRRRVAVGQHARHVARVGRQRRIDRDGHRAAVDVQVERQHHGAADPVDGHVGRLDGDRRRVREGDRRAVAVGRGRHRRRARRVAPLGSRRHRQAGEQQHCESASSHEHTICS